MPKGKYYTFSGNFKSTSEITLSLSYQTIDGGYVTSEQIVEPSDDFERSDVTIYFEDNELFVSNLTIEFAMGNGTAYIDDIQLEEGQVANLYNIIENSDFSEGLNDWQLFSWSFTGGEPLALNEVFEVVNINNDKNTALKVNLNPLYGSRFIKEFPISGKAGDIYNVSFWYKNKGIPGDGAIVGNAVTAYFKPVGREADYCIVSSEELHVDENVWQYFTFRYIAPEDYESIRLIFNQGRESNSFLMTNLMFYKDLSSINYEYDQKGNVISVKESSKDVGTTFKYNKDNQLISSTNVKGSNFSYEYDNIKKTRLLSAISSTGISNKIKYDTNGNPYVTSVSKKANEELVNGKYRIRSKGTEKYIKANYRDIFVASDACSNTVWKLETSLDKFKVIYDVLPLYHLCASDLTLCLTTAITDNNLFIFEKNDNGSFYIKCNNGMYCKVNNDKIELSNLVFGDSSFEFYIEPVYEKFIENSATYTDDGKYLSSVTDSNFNTTEYLTDSETGLVTSITNPKNQITNYSYNAKKQLTSVSQNERVVNYEYNSSNLLSKVQIGEQQYNLIYDDFLNLKSVVVGNNIVLVSHDFDDYNGDLIKTNYGNQQSIEFQYDSFNRIDNVKKSNKTYYYKYDNNSNLAQIITDNQKMKYIYDLSKRIKEYRFNNFKINYEYDINDNVILKQHKLHNVVHSVENTLNKDDELIKMLLDEKEFAYEYDELGRLVNRKINNEYISSYKYISNGNRVTTLVKSLTNGNACLSYEYDDLNNITHIYLNEQLINQYNYDDYNELIQEYDYEKNIKINYEYDNLGNILRKTKRDLSSNTIMSEYVYEYNNTNWKDQLTKYDNKIISYDDIGNPVTIGQNIQLSWIDGSLLNAYIDSNLGNNIQYKYDVNGIRIEKTVNGVVTNYFVENKKIIYEKRGDNLIYYLYDATGLCGLEYNNSTYYYIKNIQGDIIGILDSSYNQIVFYEYDAWGQVISVKDVNGNNITDLNHIGLINPFRYREYYYDNETKMYYLNNRYYIPEWGRFLNADHYIGANGDILGYNLYAYVSNNPINNIDSDGNGLFKTIKNFIKRVVDTVSSIIGIKKKMPEKKVVSSTSSSSSSSSSKSSSVSYSTPVKKNSTITSNLPTDNILTMGKNPNDELPLYGTPGTNRKNPSGTKERWWGDDGFPLRDRHYTDHGNPKKHPVVPHDHDWGKNEDGDPEMGSWREPDADEFKDVAITTGLVVGGYFLIKWGVAALLSVPTGGGSFIVAGVTP